jgi:hypothetical protein
MTELVRIAHPDIPGADHDRPRAALPHYERSGWHEVKPIVDLEVDDQDADDGDHEQNDPAGAAPDVDSTTETEK